MSKKMSLMPNISIPRSRFPQDFNHSFDCFHGDVVPVDCFEVVPGDEFSYTISDLIRMSTPIVPIMGNITAHWHAVFVPLRLIWDDAEKFYGDPSNHDKISSVTPVNPASVTVPKVPLVMVHYNSSSPTFVPFIYSVQDYLQKQDLKKIYDLNSSVGDLSDFLDAVNLSVLKERVYLRMWNDLFRPSLIVPPVLISTVSNPNVYGTASFLDANHSSLKYPFAPLKGFKKYDYFTACTLSPQFGPSVALPLGTYAPVDADDAYSHATSDAIQFDGIGLTSGVRYTLGTIKGTGSGFWLNTSTADISDINVTNLYADLSQATAATINTIRYAFQLQKYYERSNYGSRYFEILNAHYGITNPDSRLQRAERLGSHQAFINISQVVSTADTVNGANGQNLGNTGAVSVTGDKAHLFTKSFSEPGYVMIVMTTKYDRSYASGFLREDLRKTRFEFYSPEFANLGDQMISKLELQLLNSSTFEVGVTPFGYQEHWAEYRYRRDGVSGTLRPGENFDIWTLADDFNGQDITLGYDFLVEDRSALSRVLATGSNGPDYIVDFRADILATREMPLYSIPGLIDHFGAL